MRSKNAFLNTFSGWLGQVLILIVNLLARRYFLSVLGEEYLGLNGLFANVISFLSMAELGIGGAITFSLYKPIAKNDIEEIKSIMRFYRLVYWSIGFFILTAGLILIPFLPYLVKGVTVDINLTVVYFLFLFDTAVTYFFSYKLSFIIANQKGYIFNVNHYLWRFLMYAIQIVIIRITRNYYYYLFAQILTTVLEYVSISRIADQMYPFLKDKNVKPLDPAIRKSIFKHTYSMVLNKVGGTMVNSTDNILVSALVNVPTVARFNNYTSVLSAAGGFLYKGITASVSSVANFSIEESDDRKKEVFDLYYMISTWLFSWLVVGMYYLLPVFIELFYGKQYLLSDNVVKMMCVNTFLDSQIILYGVFVSAMGLFWHVKFLGITEAVLNLIISIVAGRQWGVFGIILGTFLSRFIANLWVDAYVVLKIGMNKSVLPYARMLLRDVLVELVVFGCIYLIKPFLSTTVTLYFIEMLVVCIFVPNIIYYLAWRKRDSFHYLKQILSNLLALVKR